jgi:bifunctional non-homologous end joining protein LigD
MAPHTSGGEVWELDGIEVEVTHLDKVLWPADGLTKRDLLDYYRHVGPAMLPYLAGHPVTLRVFPDGIEQPGHYQRNAPARLPGWLRTAPYRPQTTGQERRLPLIEHVAGLIWYANRGAIEFHQWHARVERPDYPDWAIFDLDPGPRAGFARVLRVALLVRERLARERLVALPKTSGGSGLHLFLPLEPVHQVNAVRDWVHRLAEELSQEYPDLVATGNGATHDEDERVTIDHAQNSLARNTAAPYTLRARPGALASAPLAWDEVEEGRVRPEHFTIRTLPERLDAIGDPWAAAGIEPQRLP